MLVRDLARAMEAIAPLAYAEPWDNVGLLVGDPSAPLARVLLCIDATRDVVEEAERDGCEAIVAYHPPIFDGMKRFVAGSIAWELARRGLACFSPHTALDVADGGTNDVLADALGMTTRAPLRPAAPKDAEYKLVTFVPADHLAKVSDAIFDAGAGRIGDYRACSFRASGKGTFFGEEGTSPAVGHAGRLEEVDEVRVETVVPIARVAAVVQALRAAHPYEEPAFDLVRLAAHPQAIGIGRIGAIARADRGDVIARAKERLGVERVLVAGPTGGDASKVAVCAGSAGELVHEAARQGADLVLTGELRHHDALRAAAAGCTVVCALHSSSERLALPPLAKRLEAALGPSVRVAVSQADREPFVFA